MEPIEIIQRIRNGQNPQQIALSIVKERLGDTPMGANLINLAENNRTIEIEQIVRNLLSQQGLDYDKEFANFKNNLGL